MVHWQETQETQVQPLLWKIPWRREWQPIPVFLPAEFHGQKILAGYGSQGLEELDMTEATQHALAVVGNHCGGGGGQQKAEIPVGSSWARRWQQRRR